MKPEKKVWIQFECIDRHFTDPYIGLMKFLDKYMIQESIPVPKMLEAFNIFMVNQFHCMYLSSAVRLTYISCFNSIQKQLNWPQTLNYCQS